jgi:peptidyl-prolyl cis-trans isomerase-like 3
MCHHSDELSAKSPYCQFIQRNTIIFSQMAITLKTNFGGIKFELFCEQSPAACENFLALCASDFYTGLVFHRVIPNFIIQCGDNTGTGSGGQSLFEDSIVAPSTNVFDEPFILGYAEQNRVRSQFFITVCPQPQLNGDFCGFGKVIFGTNVVQSISRIPTLEDNYPISPVAIKSIVIHYNPFAVEDCGSVLPSPQI